MPQRMNIEQEMQGLEPKQIRLERDEFEDLKLIIKNKEEYTRVKIIQSFPFSTPYRFIAFRDQDNHEIGILEDATSLDRRSRKVLEDELKKSYFIPKIRQINDIDEDFGVPKWDVETDRGPRRFELKSREDAHSVGGGRVVIKDIDGNKYEIPNRYTLDRQSQALLEEEL